MNEPLQGDLDEQVIKDKIEAIERDRQKRHEDFYAACLELHAWAAARPLVEHQRAVGLAETRVYECITEEENQSNFPKSTQNIPISWQYSANGGTFAGIRNHDSECAVFPQIEGD
ncbi:hypothetical protein FRC14_003394 [Serendipita sp. 396]|nr:hypothetical protein FRC14_003394 [Serendipita sp. 396]